jgi:alkylation response protein AidB-like acyl-CoA dehydrogenase
VTTTAADAGATDAAGTDDRRVEDLRQAVRRWLDEHAPAKGSPDDFSASHLASPTSVADFRAHERSVFDRARGWQRQLFDAGWAGISWPSEYGGRDGASWADDVVAEEQSRYGVSTKVLSIGLQMASSVLFRHGTEEQRLAHLPPILRGDKIWCQLFSEPDAGSDLPNIGTRATASPDGWVVNGQKVWTSGASASDFGLALARTDPASQGRRGLSCFIVDLHGPGVEVRPLRQMSGGYHFSEVFLTDVPVGPGSLVGGLGDGWTVARTMLMSERASIGSGTSARSAGQLRTLAAVVGRDHDPVTRQALAGAHIRETVLDLVLGRLQGGAPIPAAGSLVKLLYSEHARLSANDALDLLGGQGLVFDDRSTVWLDRLLFAPGLRIGGGTDEIQRNQLAEQGLGLPREPRPA